MRDIQFEKKIQEPWMQNREFYDLENGIHSMKIPRTGRYQLILAGYGYGDSKGAKIQMDMSFIKVRGLQNTF